MPDFAERIDATEAVMRVMQAAGLRETHVLVLISLSRRGSATREGVCEDMGGGAAQHAVDRILYALEESGHARRSRENREGDKRRVDWVITDEGRLALSKLGTAIVAGVSTMPSSKAAAP